MTVTYTDADRNPRITADAFVPRYARARRTRKGVRTWMILAPIGALVFVGGGAAMVSGGAESQPLVEPEPVSPVVRPLETTTAPFESSVAPAALANSAAPEPLIREAPPAPPPAVQRRDAGEGRAALPQAVTPPRVEAAPEPTEPRADSASPATFTTPAPTAAAPTATPPAPAIQTTPLN